MERDEEKLATTIYERHAPPRHMLTQLDLHVGHNDDPATRIPWRLTAWSANLRQQRGRCVSSYY